jgi:hypothetical protein
MIAATPNALWLFPLLSATGLSAGWVNAMTGGGGLVVLPHKRGVYALYDAYGVEYFKQGGRGYQARMNAVLKAYVDAQLEKRPQSRP